MTLSRRKGLTAAVLAAALLLAGSVGAAAQTTAEIVKRGKVRIGVLTPELGQFVRMES